MKRFSTLGTVIVLAVAGLTLAIGACASHDARRSHGASAPLYATEAHSDYGMVSTGSIESTRAAVRILEQGGNAVDAAVAAAFAIGVSEAGNSGLGGMTYILVANADGRAVAIDGSSPVPIAANREELSAIKADEGSFGYKSASVPTTLAALVHTLERYGTMDLAQVMAPAIEIARQGYELTPAPIAWMQPYLTEIRASDYLRFFAFEDGLEVGKPGSVYCRPDLGATLERIVAEGADSFYEGSIAREIVDDMARHGGMSNGPTSQR